MNMRPLLAATALLVLSTTLFAQDAAPPKPAAAPAAPSAADQKAMMDAWMKSMAPSDAHKKLEPMVGSWDASVTVWMPGAPPMTSTGTAENKWVLGGRFIQQTFTGTFMGQPYHGMGYTGYDNVTKKYIGTWMDDMATGIMISSGNASGANTIAFSATNSDPMTGKETTVDETVTMMDNDHQKIEMFEPGPDGKKNKTMEIVYTRHK